MAYTIKEIYHTLQGEGVQAGRVAVFCRFSGCNLWSGREEDRDTALCAFCDTDFVGIDGPGGGRFESAGSLAAAVAACRGTGADTANSLVVLTGGEPLLQVDEELLAALHARGFEVAVETNGTIPPPPGVDWLTVSPKAGGPLAVAGGAELKLVHPQDGVDPAQFEDLDFRHFCLQPMDGPEREANTRRCAQYCLEHPRWRLSLQMHKIVGLR